MSQAREIVKWLIPGANGKVREGVVKALVYGIFTSEFGVVKVWSIAAVMAYVTALGE